VPSSGADPFLCLFANTVEDIALIDSELYIKQEVRYLRQKEETDLSQIFKQKMEKTKCTVYKYSYSQRVIQMHQSPRKTENPKEF
jgi:hypothetical protein